MNITDIKKAIKVIKGNYTKEGIEGLYKDINGFTMDAFGDRTETDFWFYSEEVFTGKFPKGTKDKLTKDIPYFKGYEVVKGTRIIFCCDNDILQYITVEATIYVKSKYTVYEEETSIEVYEEKF